MVAVTYMNLGTLEMYRDNVEKNLVYVTEAARIYEVDSLTVNEPCFEKTALQSFLPGTTQAGLYRHRRWLEA